MLQKWSVQLFLSMFNVPIAFDNMIVLMANYMRQIRLISYIVLK